jgi:hypothetical protein
MAETAAQIRMEVVGADALGVRYRVVAAFAHELEVLESGLSLATQDAGPVAEALMRVSAEIERAAQPVAAAAGF